jgi:hypothetical protein
MTINNKENTLINKWIKKPIDKLINDFKEKKKELTFIGFLGSFAMFGINSGYEAVYDFVFPPMDRTQDIINNQNSKFESIKNSLDSLGNSVTSDQKEILTKISDDLKKAGEDRDKIVGNLKAIYRENKNLRNQLKKQTNADWGVDVRLNDSTGIRIDKLNSFGISSRSNNGLVKAYLSSPIKENIQDAYLNVGESFQYINDNNKQCSITNLGFNDDEMSQFSINCVS